MCPEDDGSVSLELERFAEMYDGPLDYFLPDRSLTGRPGKILVVGALPGQNPRPVRLLGRLVVVWGERGAGPESGPALTSPYLE